MIFRGAFGLFSKKYPKGGPLEYFEFFSSPPKILHNTHMRSHKKFWAKKMIFRGAFGLSERKKIQSGVWWSTLALCILREGSSQLTSKSTTPPVAPVELSIRAWQVSTSSMLWGGDQVEVWRSDMLTRPQHSSSHNSPNPPHVNTWPVLAFRRSSFQSPASPPPSL